MLVQSVVVTVVFMFDFLTFRDTNANRMRLQVSRIGLSDYETYHYDKEKLKEICKLH